MVVPEGAAVARFDAPRRPPNEGRATLYSAIAKLQNVEDLPSTFSPKFDASEFSHIDAKIAPIYYKLFDPGFYQ